jgi:uncharacterized membrane protein
MPAAIVRPSRAFLLVCLVAATVVYALTLAKHYTFHSSVYDLGIFHQVLWNTAHGHFFEAQLKHMNYLGDHFSPSLAVLAPLAWSPWPVPTLLLAQALAMVVIAHSFYAITLERGLGPLPAWAIGLATLFHPALFLPLFFDFHPEPFIAASLARGLLHLERGQQRRAVLFFALALGGKEDVALVVAPLGLALAWKREWRLFGVLLSVGALVWFALAMKVFMPAFRPPTGNAGWFYQARYAHLGRDMGSVARFVLEHPFTAFARSATATKEWTLLFLLLPFGLATLPGGRFVLAAAPLGAVHFLSGKGAQFYTAAQYLLPLVPLLAYAACQGARHTTARFPRTHLLVAVGCAIGLSLLPRFQRMGDFRAGVAQSARHDAVALVPDGVSACANNYLGAHLAGRREFELCVAPTMARDQYDFFHWPLAVRAEWQIFDANAKRDDPLSEPRADALLAAGGQLVFQRDGVRVIRASPDVLNRARMP